MGTQAIAVKMGTNAKTLTHFKYCGVQRRRNVPPLHSPDVSSHFIKGETLIGGLGQQGNKCQGHTDQDFILLQRWMGILIRTCESLRQRNAWTATQHRQIYIFMNNNIVSIAACVGDQCIKNNPCLLFNGKKEILCVMQTEHRKAAAKD